MSVKTDDSNMIRDLTLRKKKTRYCKRPQAIKAYVEVDDVYHVPMAHGIARGLKVKKKKHKKIEIESNITLRDHQKPIYKKCILALQNKHTYFIQGHCSIGKTIMALHSIARVKLLTLVVLHDYNLLAQWANTIYDCLEDAKVYVMGKSHTSCIKDLKITKRVLVKKFEDANILLTLPTAIGKLDDDEIRSIGYVICDELKVLCTEKTVQKILLTSPRYLLGLSADYERKDGMHVIIDKLFGMDKHYEISQKPFEVVKVTTPFVPFVKDASDWTSVIESLAINEDRNKQICKMILEEYKMGDKVLVICHRTFHVEIMENILKEFMNVETLYKDKKGYKNCNILCGTNKKLGRGFDGKNSCKEGYDGIPFNKLYYLAEENDVEQPAGRVFRSDKPIIYDFVDDLKAFREHWENRKKWYISRNGTIIERYMRMMI